MTVRNCEVRSHYWAILLLDSRRNTVVDNRAVGVEMGYPVTRSHQNKLIRNYLRDSTHWFGYGLFEGSSNNRLVDNVAVDCDNSFVVGDGNKNRFTGNVARDGRGKGYTVHPAEPEVSGNRGNVFKDNSAFDNGNEGFWDSTDGFRGDAGTDNRYEGNVCRGNGSPSHPATLCD